MKRCEQKIVAGDALLAAQIAETATLIEVPPDTTIIEQAGDDGDVYFIVAGSFDVMVNGRKQTRRFPNDHVGEMAAIQPTQRRSASVVATETSVLCKLSAVRFI